MAMGTTPHPQQDPSGQHTAPLQQHQAPTAGMMQTPRAAAAQTKDTPPADPVLFEDIDPVLLVRLYPHSKSGEEARGLAEKAGAAAHDAGAKLIAAQQEPVADLPPA